MNKYAKVAAIAAIAILFCFQNASANEIKRKILQNGLVVLIEESHKAPLAAIEARVKTGSATEQGYLGSGISHFVEHMLFKGTQKRPNPGDIEREIKGLGGYTNGFTSHDSTGFQVIVPSEHLNNALEIIKDILTDSLFDQDEIEKERDVILKEIRLDRDEPARYLSRLFWSNMFKVHNYRFPVIGYEPIFKKLKREDLLNYYRTFYIPDNIVVSIAGDVNSVEVLKRVEDLFGQIERVSPIQTYSAKEPPQITGPLEVEEERELAVAYLSMGFHSVAARDRDLFSLDVLSIVLGGGEDSRLFKSLYRQKKLVYSIGSFNYTPKDPGVFIINAILKKENIQKTLDGIWAQIEDLKTRSITDGELEKAKNQVLSGYIFSRQTVQDEAGDLGSGEIITGDYDFSRKYVEGVKAVTKEMVLDAAKRYLVKENATVVKLVPKGAESKEAVGHPPGKSAFPKIEKLELKNNLRVLLLEDRSLPIISLTAVGLGGLRTEDLETNGISNLVSQTLLCGTKKMTEDDISSRIEGVGAALNSFAGNNTFGLSADCLTKNLDLVLDIFSDVLQNPEFSPDKVEREKAVIQGQIKSITDDIYRVGVRTLKYVLFRRHPYRFQIAGRPSTVAKFTQSELFGYHRAYYRPAGMVLAISGDIDKQHVKEKVSALFEKFENSPPLDINPPKARKKIRPRVLSRNIEKEQSLVLLGYLGATINSHDEYVLGVLSSVLSGINGRLSQRIREKKGLAYALDAKAVAGLERGFIIFYVGTTKENLEVAKDDLFDEIELLKKEGITDRELASAKNELIGLQRIGLQKVQDVAMRAALSELYGFKYDDFLRYEDRVRHVTKECVLRAARKYLNRNSYVLLLLKGTKGEIAG